MEERDRECALFGACKWINYKVGYIKDILEAMQSV
jgi:hypothetical protein